MRPTPSAGRLRFGDPALPCLAEAQHLRLDAKQVGQQILGRVLRMPNVRKKQDESLNRAYAFAVSDSISEVARTLRDGLVHAGFERQDANDLIRTETAQTTPDPLREQASVSLSLPVTDDCVVLPEFSDAPEATRKRIENKIGILPETGSMTLRGEWTAGEQMVLKAAFLGNDSRGDKCRFVMVRDHQWQQIEDVLR